MSLPSSGLDLIPIFIVVVVIISVVDVIVINIFTVIFRLLLFIILYHLLAYSKPLKCLGINIKTRSKENAKWYYFAYF